MFILAWVRLVELISVFQTLLQSFFDVYGVDTTEHALSLFNSINVGPA